MAYTVKINSIAADGTNLYFEASISDGAKTFPPIYPVFTTDTTAAAIDAYFQSIANNAPTLPGSIGVLVGKTYTQA